MRHRASGESIGIVAKSNFVYRLTRYPYGMFRGRAEAFVDDVEEVR